MDTTDSEIVFDSNGICNKCTSVLNKLNSYPYTVSKLEKKKRLRNLVINIKKDGKKKPYDCIIGVSGGVDSTYVAYITKKLGLRPLAVHLDNGWDSELAQKNIEVTLKKLNIDLYTYVIDWEEFKDLQLAFLKASTPDSEIPSDHAIVALLHQVAKKHNITYILTGVNTATESIGSPSWSNGIYDWRYLSSIQKLFGTKKLRSLPKFTLLKLFIYRYILKINRIAILDYLDYDKRSTLQLLKDKLSWRYYGDKHYESIYTRFFQAYILPQKFGFDKRKIHLSSLICSGQMTRKQALLELKKPLYEKNQLREDKEYIIKKLGLTEKKFNQIMNLPPKKFTDFPSYQREWYYKIVWKLNERYKMRFKDKYFL